MENCSQIDFSQEQILNSNGTQGQGNEDEERENQNIDMFILFKQLLIKITMHCICAMRQQPKALMYDIFCNFTMNERKHYKLDSEGSWVGTDVRLVAV